jgi:putative peptidoglycan lipid II flippase
MAVVLVGTAAAATRGVALVKELAVAARFGTGDALDAFLLAMAVPVFIAGAFRSALLASLVPRLVAARERNGASGNDALISAATIRHLGVAVAVAAVLVVVSGPAVHWLGGAFDESKRALTARLLRLLALLVVFDGLAAVWTAALHARRKLVAATAGAAATPLATLAALAFLAGARPEILVIGTLFGAALEAVWAGWLLRRDGATLFLRAGADVPEVRGASRGFALLAAGAILMSLNPIVDQIMAAWLDPGSVSSLGFGGRLSSGIVGLVGTALATAAFPRYSAFAAAGDRTTLGRALRRDLAFAIVLGSMAAIVLFAASAPIVRILFQRGAFTPEDTELVSRIQAFYVLQIPGYLSGILAARVLNALGRDGTMLVMAACAAALNAGANLLMMWWLGAPGIALSTALVYTVSAVLLIVSSTSALSRHQEGAAP